MAKTITTLPPLLLLLSLFTASLSATCTFPSPSPPAIKGMFIFGSSYVDNGNNNFLAQSFVKANYIPYGIDFALGPSGRFTNGKNVVDLLGDELGLPQYIPVFTSPDTRGDKIIYGVDFASGASGILDETGSFLGVISLKQQIRNFEEVTLAELEEQVGCRSRESLPNYLFVLGTGGNDYSLNYFLKIKAKNTNFNVSLQAFTANLTTSLSLQIKKLYDLGARKFVLMSLYPIGCNPVIRSSQSNQNHCVEAYNKAVHLFNVQLKSLVDELKLKMPGSNLVYVNAYKVIRDIIKNPASKGFEDATSACCEVETFNGKNLSSCKRGGSTCANRDTHVYFDGTHPTEAVNKLIAKSAYSSNVTAQVYPFSVKQLALV